MAPVPGLDVDDYIEVLIDRFSNPHIRDQIARLCQDGSGKFPKFLLPTVRTQLDADGPIDLAALILATWCQYLLGTTDSGAAIEIAMDPLVDLARAAAEASVEDPAAFLGFSKVFGADLETNERLVTAFDAALRSLRDNGVRTSIASYTSK